MLSENLHQWNELKTIFIIAQKIALKLKATQEQICRLCDEIKYQMDSTFPRRWSSFVRNESFVDMCLRCLWISFNNSLNASTFCIDLKRTLRFSQSLSGKICCWRWRCDENPFINQWTQKSLWRNLEPLYFNVCRICKAFSGNIKHR